MYISYFTWLLMYISYFIWLLPKKSPSRWIFMFLLLDKKIETQEEKRYAGYEGQKKVKVKVTQSSLTLKPHELYSPWNSPSQNTGVVSLSLLQGVFPTQGSNPGHLYCRWTFYQLSHNGSPRILEWVAYPFSRRSSWPKNWTRVSCIADGVFATWAIRDDQQSRGSIQTLLNPQHDAISSLFIWRLLASIFLELFPLPQLCYLPMLLTNLLWLFLFSKEKYWKTSGLAKSELNISRLHQLQDSIKWQSLQMQTWPKRTRRQTTLIYHLKIFFQLNILIMIWWVQIIVVCHMLPSWTI